jgi:hypothetical protein
MDITKLSAEQRLHRSHVALMNHKKFILMSGILVSGKTEVVDSGIPTACTDGLNTIYNRNFVTNSTRKNLTLWFFMRIGTRLTSTLWSGALCMRETLRSQTWLVIT